MTNTTRLKELRKKKGVNQETLCEVLEISQSTYSAKEKTGDFTDEELKKIARVLNVNVEELESNSNNAHIGDVAQFLAEKAVQQESMLRVLLSAVGELLAEKEGITSEEMKARLIKAVNSQSLRTLDKLK